VASVQQRPLREAARPKSLAAFLFPGSDQRARLRSAPATSCEQEHDEHGGSEGHRKDGEGHHRTKQAIVGHSTAWTVSSRCRPLGTALLASERSARARPGGKCPRQDAPRLSANAPLRVRLHRNISWPRL